MERLRRRVGTRVKRGITQEEASLGIERGKRYKGERSLLILAFDYVAFELVTST